MRALVERGASVRVLDDLSSGLPRNLEDLPVEQVVGDVSDAACANRVMRGAEVVFHFAASVGNARSLADPIRDSRVNVLGTLNVLEAAHRSGVRAVIISSSAAIFGELRTNPIDESHPQDPITPYGVSKMAAERHSMVYGRLHGMTVVALRYFNVYGPRQRFDQYGNVIPIFVHQLLHGETLTVFGDGEQTRDFVHVDDVVQANLLAAERGRGVAVYNVGSGTVCSINELVDLLRSINGDRLRVQHGAPRTGDVRHCRADISAISADLGFAPRRQLSSALPGYVAWFEDDMKKGGP